MTTDQRTPIAANETTAETTPVTKHPKMRGTGTLVTVERSWLASRPLGEGWFNSHEPRRYCQYKIIGQVIGFVTQTTEIAVGMLSRKMHAVMAEGTIWKGIGMHAQNKAKAAAAATRNREGFHRSRENRWSPKNLCNQVPRRWRWRGIFLIQKRNLVRRRRIMLIPKFLDRETRSQI